jgi:hypothetical protein
MLEIDRAAPGEEAARKIDQPASLIAGAGQTAASGISNVLSNFTGNRASALLGSGEDKVRARLGGLDAITGANTEAGQAKAGGLIGAANAEMQGNNALLGILGDVGKFFLGGGLGNVLGGIGQGAAVSGVFG